MEKENTNKDNSSSINDILNQIEQDNKIIQDIPPRSNQNTEENIQINNEPDIEDDTSIFDILWYEFKGPILVAILCILFTFNSFDSIFEKFIPFLWSNDNNSINYIGLVIKAILFGVIYFIVNKYIL